jgi:hypothetical protein
MPAPTPDPALSAVNFTAAPVAALAGRANGLRPQTSGGQQLMDAANTAGDYLKDLKLTNLDKKMAEIGQRNFAIGAAARNTLIDAGLRSPTAAPAMVLRSSTPGKPSPISL